MAEPKSSAELRLVLRIYHGTTVGKFATLVNTSGQTLHQTFLTYLEILWQQGEKTNKHTTTKSNKLNSPEIFMFLLQCTLDNKPQKF